MDLEIRGSIFNDVSMSSYTSWKAGGLARKFFIPADKDDLINYLYLKPEDEEIYPIGLGSNLLVRDNGFDGTIVLMHTVLSNIELNTDRTITAESGVASPKLARFSARSNLIGGAFLAGIPGTVGGALAMNAGCYGSETWDFVHSVEVMDSKGVMRQRPASHYEVGYRYVALKSEFKIDNVSEIFISGTFKFEEGNGDDERTKIRNLLTSRIESQPLNMPNAGSVFRNPENNYAAKLIEESGLKGTRIGNAQISEKHANFIVNLGDATAQDIESLIELAQNTVLEKFGIQLHREVKIIGKR